MTAERIDSNANVSKSGNSDVDVKVIVDTTALAYVFSTYLYAEGKLNDKQYHKMLSDLEKHSKRYSAPKQLQAPVPQKYDPWL